MRDWEKQPGCSKLGLKDRPIIQFGRALVTVDGKSGLQSQSKLEPEGELYKREESLFIRLTVSLMFDIKGSENLLR